MNNQLNLFKNCFDGIGYQLPIQLTLTTNNDIVSYSISQPDMRNIKLDSGSFRARQCKRTSKRFVSAIQVQQRLTKKSDQLTTEFISDTFILNWDLISAPPPPPKKKKQIKKKKKTKHHHHFLIPESTDAQLCNFCYCPVSTVTLFTQHCKAKNRPFNASSKQFILSAFPPGWACCFNIIYLMFISLARLIVCLYVIGLLSWEQKYIR